jgi:heparan-alpha-glucosaminide N-acetyltransferase
LISLGVGYGLGELGICPVVKKIWTPSWVLFSGGYCLIALGITYAVLDLICSRGDGYPVIVRAFRAAAFPLVVIGANSIAAYLMTWLFKSWIAANLRTHLGQEAFRKFGAEYEPTVLGAGVVLVMWLMLFWMYKRKIFLRV